MSETNEAGSSPAAEAGAPEAAEANAAAESTSAETENTEAAPEAPAAPGPVPYTRFREINEEKKGLRAENEALKAELAELKKPAKPAAPELAEPPAHLSPDQKVQWYVEHHARGLLKRELGLDLAEIKAALEVSRALAGDHAERSWSEVCRANNVDPKDPAVRKEAAELLRAGVPVEKAAKVAAMLAKGNGKQTPAGTAANAETGGGMSSTQMMKDDWATFSKEEAVDAAHRGKRAPHLTVEQIFQRAAQRGK